MFDGEVPSGAAHAGHDFIGNQQNAMAAADFRNLLQITRRRKHRAQGGAADRLKDEGGGFTVGGFNRSLQLGRIFQTTVAAAVRAVVTAAVAVWNSYVCELAHHGQINFASPLVAGDGKRAQSRAVITLCPAQHLVTPGLSNLHLILPRQLESGFDRFRSAAGEVHGASPKILSGKLKELARVLFRDRSGELAGVGELQLRQLPGHGGSDFGNSVSDEVYRRGAGKIQVALAFRVPQVNTLATNGGRECLSERTPKNGGASRVLLVRGMRHTLDYPAG